MKFRNFILCAFLCLIFINQSQGQTQTETPCPEALLRAVQNKEIDLVTRYLEHAIYPDIANISLESCEQIDDDRQSLLHVLMYNWSYIDRSADIYSLLVSHGADVNKEDSRGNTPKGLYELFQEASPWRRRP